MEPIIVRNPKVMHGSPCFVGTRVEAQTLFDHLKAGYSIDEFLEQFPTVRRESILRLLDVMCEDVTRVAVLA